MTALVLAFTLGLGLAHLKSEVLKNAARDFQEIVIRMISAVILPLLPIYIFGIFLNMTHSGQVFGILMVFIKIIGVIFLLHIFLLVFQYSIAALFVRKNPLKLLGTDDACLLHGSRHSIQCRHYPRNIGAKSEERRLCRYCRIRHPTLRHHPSVGQHIEDCGMRPGTDDNARHAHDSSICRIHLHAGHHYGSRSGVPEAPSWHHWASCNPCWASTSRHKR